MAEPFVAKVNSQRLHAALKVKSLDDSVSFYHGVMGLPILMEVGQPGNPRTIFLPGIQLLHCLVFDAEGGASSRNVWSENALVPASIHR